MRVPSLAFALAATAVGCGPARVGGSIDGDHVGGARDAIYDRVSVDLGFLGDYEVTILILTDFPDACATYESFYDDAIDTCDNVCESYTVLAEELHLNQESYWSTVITVNTSDGTDGEFDYDADIGEGEFAAGFFAYDAVPLRDAGDCEDTCNDGELLVPDIDDGESGELELTEHDDQITGKFDVAFGGEDRVGGTFNASPCDMSDWGVFSFVGL